ncbi:hypothetical protein LINGRAHAP2_LOCUS10200 [Linum grandiflorum]
MSWQRPPTGTLKVNTDARILGGGEMGVDVVVRDGKGRFLAAAIKRTQGVWQPELVKAATVEFDLKFANGMLTLKLSWRLIVSR